METEILTYKIEFLLNQGWGEGLDYHQRQAIKVLLKKYGFFYKYHCREYEPDFETIIYSPEQKDIDGNISPAEVIKNFNQRLTNLTEFLSKEGVDQDGF